ncbi:HIRAN domain-containing protein [Sphingomonas montanisoli]|uniref:HIRAN domain-containing protein n=1 Tax=Sphingomonas montanisoli TaxID=2606412 RepID=A0A5D9C1L1_9SPHN|nr:HIRAN domain-containing protein [Sphingomonas montanisoli]TZG25614.1 hypothetical protein FYJ91_11350 [Sphingomonas montanisoli]
MPLRTLSLDVVGADHPNRRPGKQGKIPRRYEIQLCEPGEPISLELEPDNPVDPNAVRVMSARGIQIGYIRHERSMLISGYIRDCLDIRGIFQRVMPWGAIIRITTDGSEPELPPAPAPSAQPLESRAFVDEDPGFYPDPEWPE